MHQRLVELTEQRENVDLTKSGEAGIVLMDKLGLVPISDWPAFVQTITARVTQGRKQPKRPAKKNNCGWCWSGDTERTGWFKAVGPLDGEKLGNWLDENGWGIGELRDNDKQWNSLNESIRPYCTTSNYADWLVNTSYIPT